MAEEHFILSRDHIWHAASEANTSKNLSPNWLHSCFNARSEHCNNFHTTAYFQTRTPRKQPLRCWVGDYAVRYPIC